jgi:uncharacterized protein (UPF0335 family)
MVGMVRLEKQDAVERKENMAQQDMYARSLACLPPA